MKDKSGWSWPGPKARWCTELLKTRVINKYLDDLRNQYSMVQLIGLAADEQARLNREHNQNPEHRHPLVEWSWTEADCLKYCYDAGLIGAACMTSLIGFPVGVVPFRVLMNCENYESISRM